MRRILRAYADGFNARVQEGDLPPQFDVVGAPRPWTPDDSLAVFMLLPLGLPAPKISESGNGDTRADRFNRPNEVP